MKKIIVPVVAALLFCGVVNAQTTQKKPEKATAAPAAAKAKAPAKNSSEVAKVATAAPKKTVAPAGAEKKPMPAIKRKHKSPAKPKGK